MEDTIIHLPGEILLGGYHLLQSLMLVGPLLPSDTVGAVISLSTSSSLFEAHFYLTYLFVGAILFS